MPIKLIAGAALLLAALSVSSPARATELLYAIGSNDQLFTMNPSTGQATLVATTSDGYYSNSGLAFLGTNLYLTNFVQTGGFFNFGTMNTSTAAFTFVSDENFSSNWDGLAPNRQANLMYTVDLTDSNLLKSVPSSGVGTPIGSGTGIGGTVSGLAYDNESHILYAATLPGAVYTINTTTGIATEFGSTGLPMQAFASLAYDDQTRVLYMDAENMSSGACSLYTVNVSTGAATLVGSNGGVTIDSIAFTPVPEPSTWSLATLGAGGLWFVRRRRR